MENLKSILKINSIKGYKVSCLFNNGEARIIDFEAFFQSRKNFSASHPAYKLLQDESTF